MREFTIFYYSKCEHYAYYRTSRHLQCSKCGAQEAMYMVRMHYTESIRMPCDERDEFLSREIPRTNSSLVIRLTEPHGHYDNREIAAEMNNVAMNLGIENKILSDTTKRMHDTIWGLTHEKREPGQDKVPACGVCRDRQPSEKSMGETVETEQTEAVCSEAAAVDMSRTTVPEKGQEEQPAVDLKEPDLKNI